MARYQITAPDGRVITVEGDSPPTEADAEQIFASLPAAEKPATTEREFSMPTAGSRFDVPMRGVGKPAAIPGMGVLADIGTEAGAGLAGQTLGSFVGPVGTSVGGAIGSGVGNVLAQRRRMEAGEQEKFRPGELASSVITGAIPGAPLAATGTRAVVREAGKQAAGALTGLQTQALIEGRDVEPVEAAMALGLPAVGGALAQRTQAASPSIQSAVKKAETGTGAVKRATFKEVQEAGYFVPPSAVNPSATAKGLESIAGKAAVRQEVMQKNQEVTNRLAKRALGLPEDEDITPLAIKTLREEASKPYEEIAKLSPSAADTLRALREARVMATRSINHYKKSALPAALDDFDTYSQLAESLEQALEKEAIAAGKSDLVPKMVEARKRIAKSYDVENALLESTGDVSAPALRNARNNRNRPLTGELNTIANFAEAFEPYAGVGTKVTTPGVSATVPTTVALLATLGYQASQSPYGVVLGTLPLVRGTVREGVLSRTGQNILANMPPPNVEAIPDIGAAGTRILAQRLAKEGVEDEPEPPPPLASRRNP